MKSLIAAGLLTGALLAATPALARDIQVEITNLTAGIYFTPLLVAAHDRHSHLFEPGTEASAELQALAEGGDSSGLIHFLEDIDSVYAANPASGLLPPGESATANLEVHGQRHSHLSIVAMLLPTNDGFVGLDALPIPHGRGSYTYFLKGYDAGTEANDEVINGGGAPGVPGIPADPGLLKDHRGVEKHRVDAGDLLQHGHGDADREHQLHGGVEQFAQGAPLFAGFRLQRRLDVLDGAAGLARSGAESARL